MDQLHGIKALRRRNLQSIIRKYGGARILAKTLGVDESRISHLVHEVRPMGERTARRFESALRLPADWFDMLHDTFERHEIDAEFLADVMVAVENAAHRAKVTMTPEHMANLVSLAYHAGARLKTVDQATIRALLKVSV
jgi:hypothetical protein